MYHLVLNMCRANSMQSTKTESPKSNHAPGASVFYLSGNVVLFSSHISRSICANVFSPTRKCRTVGSQSLGIPRGGLAQRTQLLVIWDGSPIHRGKEVKAYLADGATKYIHLEALPPYAPDLNPDEGVWNHLKDVELRNVCCLDLGHLRHEFDLAVTRLRRKPYLIQSFFAGAGLDNRPSLYPGM